MLSLPVGCSYSFSSIKECRNGRGINPKSCLAVAEKQLAVELRSELMPKHVGIIIDGNGRWAKKRGLSVEHGHEAGSLNMRHVIANSVNHGIKVLSIYSLSTENWSRPNVEVDFLLRVFEGFIRSDVTEFIRRLDIRFSAIGNTSRLPESLQNAISSAEEMSKTNKGMHLIMVVSYSGRDEILHAVKEIATKVEHGILRPNNINEPMFERHLMTNILEFPNPDLLIRTSGELRISNFLLWQLAYTELYFADKLFPDFGEADLVEALASYQRRQRRYGQRMN